MTISNNKQTPGIIQLFRVTFLLYATKGVYFTARSRKMPKNTVYSKIACVLIRTSLCSTPPPSTWSPPHGPWTF